MKNFAHAPASDEAIDAILSCATQAGLRAGIYCRTVEYARAMAAKGFDLVTVTSDQHLLAAGAESLARFSA